MTPEKLEAAIEVVGRLAGIATEMPTEQKKAFDMAAHLTITLGFMVEYAVHLSQGCEHEEAILKAIRGELRIGGSGE